MAPPDKNDKREKSNVDHGQFDDLTRNVVSGVGARRMLLRFFAGIALGGMAPLLGLGEAADAKSPKHGKRQNGHKRSSHLQAAGKKKKHRNNRKGKGKDKDKPRKPVPPLPPGCEHCGECQMCQDGACVPDPDLELVRCADSGETCGLCSDGQCLPTVDGACADGSCPARGECCPEQFQCDSGKCIDPLDECCPGQRLCGEDVCIPEDQCCADEKKCRPDGPCFPVDFCCLHTQPTCGACQQLDCVDGDWVCEATCETAGHACCGGSCVSTTCPPGQEFDSASCQCQAGVCPDGPDSCADWAHYPCGNDPYCHCIVSVEGGNQCTNTPYPYQIHCDRDADCDFIWGTNKGICGACKHQCYHKCPA